jgi:hypothetical protein
VERKKQAEELETKLQVRSSVYAERKKQAEELETKLQVRSSIYAERKKQAEELETQLQVKAASTRRGRSRQRNSRPSYR